MNRCFSCCSECFYLPLLIFSVLVYSAFPLMGQKSTALQNAIEKVVATPEMKHASLGICVLDAKTGAVIAEHDKFRSLIPASTLKVVTTATAIGVLGAEYKYTTTLAYDGTLENGVLDGNLYLQGTGDPTLGSDQMEGGKDLTAILSSFGDAVEQAGIQEIKGYIIGDGSYFETAVNGKSWPWYDLGNYYGAGVSGLNIHENLYYLTFQQGGNLSTPPTILGVRPSIPYLTFENELKTAGAKSGDNAYIFGAPYTYHRFIRGSLPLGTGEFTIKGSVPNSAYWSAYLFHNYLRAQTTVQVGNLVSTQGQLKREGRAQEADRTPIYSHYSPTLKEIVYRANKKSVNLYCESMLKMMGQKKEAEGSTEAGVKVVQNFWESRGVNLDGWVMEDGSGLSPKNTITAHQMATMLSKISKDETLYATIYPSLSGAGAVRSKSGSMERVRCYVGYVKTKSGKLLSFALLGNNFLGKSSVMRKHWKALMKTMESL